MSLTFNLEEVQMNMAAALDEEPFFFPEQDSDKIRWHLGLTEEQAASRPVPDMTGGIAACGFDFVTAEVGHAREEDLVDSRLCLTCFPKGYRTDYDIQVRRIKGAILKATGIKRTALRRITKLS